MRKAACLRCRSVFSPTNRRGKASAYCSALCRRLYRKAKQPMQPKRMRRTSTCQQCGKTYTPKQSSRVTYCSRQCAFDHKRQQAQNRRWGKATPLVARPCSICQKPMLVRPKLLAKVRCSRECRMEFARMEAARRFKPAPPKERPCAVCGASFVHQGRGNHRRFCSLRCGRKAEKKRRWLYYRAQERLRSKVVATGDKIDPYEVFNRDGWCCQLCGKPVKRGAVVPDYMAPVLDHIVPISKGGGHTKVNVQCAHSICNSRRSNVLPAQMRLFG